MSFCLKSYVCIYKRSRQEVFCKEAVLKNFVKFTGKLLCRNLFFNNVACLQPATVSKKRLRHRCFTLNFGKTLRTFLEHLRMAASVYKIDSVIQIFRASFSSSQGL